MITIILKGGAVVWVDMQIDRGRCKACRQTVFWASTCNGKKMPICQDERGNWVSHFSNCPKASQFRRKADYIPQTNGIETLTKFERRKI
jgi:hypothetical protein